MECIGPYFFLSLGGGAKYPNFHGPVYPSGLYATWKSLISLDFRISFLKKGYFLCDAQENPLNFKFLTECVKNICVDSSKIVGVVKAQTLLYLD